MLLALKYKLYVTLIKYESLMSKINILFFLMNVKLHINYFMEPVFVTYYIYIVIFNLFILIDMCSQCLNYITHLTQKTIPTSPYPETPLSSHFI